MTAVTVFAFFTRVAYYSNRKLNDYGFARMV